MINSSRSIGDLLRRIVGVVTAILPRDSSMDQLLKSCTLGKENVLGLDAGPVPRLMNTVATWVVPPRNARLVITFWMLGALLSLTQLRHLTVGDPTAST